jgi:hypothetical protein
VAATLSAEEFLRRFVQHVLPKGFVKVRHYGLLANRFRDEWLDLCRRLLMVESVRNALPETPNADEEPAVPIRCPNCGGRRIVCRELPRAEELSKAAPMAFTDSS